MFSGIQIHGFMQNMFLEVYVNVRMHISYTWYIYKTIITYN